MKNAKSNSLKEFIAAPEGKLAAFDELAQHNRRVLARVMASGLRDKFLKELWLKENDASHNGDFCRDGQELLFWFAEGL